MRDIVIKSIILCQDDCLILVERKNKIFNYT
jgi:hypothetical protein